MILPQFRVSTIEQQRSGECRQHRDVVRQLVARDVSLFDLADVDEAAG